MQFAPTSPRRDVKKSRHGFASKRMVVAKEYRHASRDPSEDSALRLRRCYLSAPGLSLEGSPGSLDDNGPRLVGKKALYLTLEAFALAAHAANEVIAAFSFHADKMLTAFDRVIPASQSARFATQRRKV